MFKQLNLRIVLVLVLILTGSIVKAQSPDKIEESKVENLISKKISMDKEGKFKDRFTIQLYYGEIDGAKRAKASYESTSMSWEANMEYEAPNFKIWVGSYRNKLEAERALIEIKKEFPNAFILKP
ncbi:MAG: SPOR domain-containing protein [Nonlabens sp.]|uniref:SPOR domain-containing protein n=1 Tax=Nonlabens sp. TaxID=1888209 RepID=UPI003EF64B26